MIRSGGGGSTGRWKNADDPYLGVKFSIKGKIHYGWVRLRVSLPSRIDAVITGPPRYKEGRGAATSPVSYGTASRPRRKREEHARSAGANLRSAPCAAKHILEHQ
jgi:hypothetical protein